MTLESNGKCFALDENRKIGIELTPNELTACKKQPHQLGNIYLCESANLLNTNVLDTCLGLLFSGSQNAIEINNRCKLFTYQVIATITMSHEVIQLYKFGFLLSLLHAEI